VLLPPEIRGQSHTIPRIISAVRRGELGITEPSRPRGSFLLLGPTGIGKTETVVVATNHVFSEGKLFRFDMSEFQNQEALGLLLGARLGEIGYLGAVRERAAAGSSLFDEAEKAHPRVLDILLQLLDAARLTVATGQTLDFSGFYSPDGRIEHSLLPRFWLVARREEGSIAAALCDPTSNEATSQKRCNPWGKGRFGLRLRCWLGRGSLRIHSLVRASPQAKPTLCKLYSILPSGEYVWLTSNIGSAELMSLQHSNEATLERHVLTRAQQILRPEIFARVNEKLVFHRLSYEHQLEIAEKFLSREIEFLAARGS
jgi:ATP-dependent Clp protease ATP-binding subunit ClpA